MGATHGQRARLIRAQQIASDELRIGWSWLRLIRGREPSWVRVRVALRATDDPDCKDGIDHASGTSWDVYDRWGDEYGGADEATRVWFRQTQPSS
jgi:hypothetical protein